jgi:Holliday junction DNA helicase RuvA
MIGKLTGIVDSLGEDWALLDVGGVGYLVHCSSRVLAGLPARGERATLYIETYVRDDMIKLFGFSSWLEREWFEHLQDVQGVGSRVALALLDALSPGELAQAVALKDKSAFARASGVGPRLATRIAAELQDRPMPGRALVTAPGDESGAYTHPASAVVPDELRREGLKDILLRNDAISALVNLGYNEVKAAQAVAAAYAGFDEDPPVDVLIKAALREIGKGA